MVDPVRLAAIVETPSMSSCPLRPWTERLSSFKWSRSLPGLDEIPTLRELASLDVKLLPAIEQQRSADARPRRAQRSMSSNDISRQAAGLPRTRMAAIKGLVLQCDALARIGL